MHIDSMVHITQYIHKLQCTQTCITNLDRYTKEALDIDSEIFKLSNIVNRHIDTKHSNITQDQTSNTMGQTLDMGQRSTIQTKKAHSNSNTNIHLENNIQSQTLTYTRQTVDTYDLSSKNSITCKLLGIGQWLKGRNGQWQKAKTKSG